MFFGERIKFQKSFRLALTYTGLIYISLYFVPYFTSFLQKALILNEFIDILSISIGVSMVVLFFYKYRIYDPKAYLLFSLVLVGFLWAFLNARFLVERFHYLEYALLYAIWFRVIRHFWSGWFRYAATLVWCALIGFLDELIQYLLPNRYFDREDVVMNIVGSSFGLAVVMIFTRFRRDKKAAFGEAAAI